MRYFLIGFMGSGKSLIGKKIAEKLNFKYIDLDNFIEQSENRTIVNIFNKSGEKYFRELEKKYLKQIIKEDNIVISTGGGTPVFHKSMYIMNNFGKTIYLNCHTEILFKRLKNNKEKRPMISNLSDENLKKYIEKKLGSRQSFYNQATYVIYNNNNSENCINNIIDILR